MRALGEGAIHAVMSVVGAVFGVLSVVALGVAAVVPAALGMLAFAFSPFRAALDRLRGGV